MKSFTCIFVIAMALTIYSGCGDVSVSLDDDTYNAKIVVDGFLIPGQVPADIRIMRNFPLNQPLEYEELFISDALVTITDVAAAKEYPLTFDPMPLLQGKIPGYVYAGGDFIIDYGKQYKLTVQASIDDQALSTSSVVTVPPAGFALLNDKSIVDTLAYNEKDAGGAVQKFTLQFQRSEGIGSYVSSVFALDADAEDSTTFIEENVFGLDWDNVKVDNEADNEVDPVSFAQFQHTWQWDITRENGSNGTSRIELEWFDFWFYGNYRVILYAADDHFTDYILTHRQIQEIDGNLLQPRFYFEGDGVGIFGAAIADTVYFYVKR